jgi:hypothetical protein
MNESRSAQSGKRNSIETLRDAVRLRPSMYFGTLGPYALYEIICCALDHAQLLILHVIQSGPSGQIG